MPTPQANGLGTVERLFETPPEPRITDLREASKEVLSGIVYIAQKQVENGDYPPPAVIKAIVELSREEPAPGLKKSTTAEDLKRFLKDYEEEP